MHRRPSRPWALMLASACWCAVALAQSPAEPAASSTGAAPLFTAEERQWLAEHPVIRVLSDAASPPFDFLTAEGEHSGLYADYLQELSRATGLRFEWSEQSRRDQLVDAASHGSGQLIAGFAVPVPAEGFVRVGRAIAQDYPVLVQRREGGGFEAGGDHQRVSLVRGYAPSQDYATRTAARQFLDSDGFEPALVDVAIGRTDLSVQSLAVAEFLIRQRGLAGLQIVGPYAVAGDSSGTLYWWVPAGAAPLAGILEKAWDSLPPERHRALRARWLDHPALVGEEPALHAVAARGDAVWPWIAVALAGTVLLLAALLWRQRRQQQHGSKPEARGPQTVERVLEESPALIFEMEQDPDGEIVVRYASQEARRLFAIDMQEQTLPVEAFLRTIYSEDQPLVVNGIQQSALERREMEQEYRVLSPQGMRWVKTIIRPLHEVNGRTVWSGVTVDIGAQKRAEQRVEQTEQRLREITDSVPGVVFQVQRDLAGGFTLNFASASLFAVRGVKAGDFNRDGEAFFDTIFEADRHRVREAMEHSAATLERLEVEYRVHMGDGRVEWMTTSAIPGRGRDGLVIWNGFISSSTRIKKAEEDLHAAQRFLRDLTDGVPGFIYQMRRDGPDAPYRLSFVSAGVSTHGLTAADAMSGIHYLFEPIDIEDRGRLLAAMDRSYASQSPFRVDYRLRLPTGLTAWMRTQAAPVSDGRGGMKWNGMTFNISEEKLREMQARRAEDRLNRLTNALPGVVFQIATTPGGDWLYPHISEATRAIYQIEPEAVLRDANVLHQMLFAEDWRRLEMALSESVHSSSDVLRECRLRRTDGALRWLRILARPQGSDGELFVWNGFAQDITDEKEAAIQAETLQRRLREVTENVPCTVFQMQRDFEDELSIRFVSENIYGLLGISREEVMEGMTRLVNRIVPDDLALMFESLESSHREQRPVFFDLRIRDTANALRWLRGSVSTPRVEDGGMVWNGAWLDITDIKELEASLATASQVAQGANRLKSEFLATMSHEIRTPMNAIIGLGQLMQQTPLSSTQHGYLAKINSASQSLLGILNDILDHSKIEAGKMSLERTEFDLNAVFDSLSAVIHLKAVEKDLELRFEVPPGLPMRLLGDPLRLGQVLLNLASNAIKFSERGTVVVRVREVSRVDGDVRLLFEVSDEGIGLSQTQIENLFQSFAQGDASTTRKYGGTGLGLTIARNLIRLMDGDIEVSSEPGQGSVFWFEARFGLSLEPQPRYDLPRDLYGLKALVVDDNEATRTVTEGWLAAFGFEVSGVDGGLAALEQVQNRGKNFALIVLDWRMPGLNGVETAERLLKLRLPSPPALLMATAYVNEELVRQCDAFGLKDFLAKPFSPSTLFQTVLAALGRAESQGHDDESIQPLVGLRVMVADDNEVNLEIITGILESAGASVRLARDGIEVMEKIRSSEFDVALLDLQMPKLDGVETARRLRSDARYATLPLVAMTAHAMPEHRLASRAAGFDAHLLKPIDRRELFDTLLRYRMGVAPAPAPVPLAAGTDAVPTAAVESGLVFDRAGALLRLGGNQALLDRLLARFAADHADAAQQIVAAIETGDTARAIREAHTLKGVAANLGAVLLAGTASTVENLLRQGETVPVPALDLLRIHQQETLRAIQQGTALATPAVAAREQSREAQRELAGMLQSLLMAHDANAKDALEALLGLLSGPPPPSLLRLRSAVENYEFEVALVALQEVGRDLNLGDNGVSQ